MFLACCIFLGSTATTDAFQHSLPIKNHQQYQLSTTSSSSFVNNNGRYHQQKKSTSSTSSTTQLSAALNPLVSIASSPVGAIVVLGTIILVHESGHYLAARFFNMTVEEFSIGFGPKLVGFTALGNEFNLRALPLGGYVKFPENYNITELQELRDTASKAFRERRTSQEDTWTTKEKIWNVLTLGEYFEEQQRKKLQQQMEKAEQDAKESTAAWWNNLRFNNNKDKKEQQSSSAKKDDPISKLDDYEIQYYDDPNLLQNRPWYQRAVVLSGGVIFNLLLSLSIYFGTISTTGLPQPIFDNGVVITAQIQSTSPALGKLERGDIITSINGKFLVSI